MAGREDGLTTTAGGEVTGTGLDSGMVVVGKRLYFGLDGSDVAGISDVVVCSRALKSMTGESSGVVLSLNNDFAGDNIGGVVGPSGDAVIVEGKLGRHVRALLSADVT